MVDSLLRQGISKQEIEKVHRDLRERGYGEEEARRRSQLALEKMKARRELEERRRAKSVERASERPMGRSEVPRDARVDASGRRAVDSLPVVPPALRRRINRWAFRRSLVARICPADSSMLSATAFALRWTSSISLSWTERAWKNPKPAKMTEMMIKIGKLKSSTLFILHTSCFGSECFSKNKTKENSMLGDCFSNP